MLQNSKRKVLFIVPSLVNGGAEKQFNIIRQGFVNFFDTYTYVSDSMESDNIGIVINPVQKPENRINAIRFAYLNVFKILIKFKIDIAFVHDPIGISLIPLLKAFGVKIIFCERNNGTHNRILSRMAIKLCNVLVANSKYGSKKLSNLISRSVHYIPNGVLVKKNEPKPRRNNDFSILVPARIDPIKNQLLAIDAVSKLENVVLHFAGKISSKSYYQEIQKVINNRNLQDRVLYKGYIENISKHYNEYDLILLPSLSEGTPNVILEGYAAHCLCLMSDIPMNRDISVSDLTIFQSNNSEDLIQHITRIISLDASNKKFILDKQYKYVVDNYNIDNMIKSYYQLVSNMVK